jgi:hypothetical protein
MGDTPTEFRAGQVVSVSFGKYTRNFVRFFLIAAVARLPLAVIGYFYTLSSYTAGLDSSFSASTSTSYGGASALIVGLLGGLISLIVGGLLQYLSFQSIRGQEMSVGTALQRVIGRLGAIFLTSLVIGIMIGIGTILLIVPGILIGLALCVGIPACLIEGRGVFDSLSRSRALTKGHRGTIFLVGLIYLALFIVAAIIVGIITYILVFIMHSILVSQILNFILTSLSTAFAGPIIAVIYYRLRVLKDGVDIQQIASVFD